MIRQFDVCGNMLAGREDKPYLVCIQHHRLDHLQTRILAPLISGRTIEDDIRLHPAFRIGGKTVYLDPTDLVTLPVRRLGVAIDNLEADRDKIIAALDLVFTGI